MRFAPRSDAHHEHNGTQHGIDEATGLLSVVGTMNRYVLIIHVLPIPRLFRVVRRAKSDVCGKM
jgi:hypothetical protein